MRQWDLVLKFAIKYSPPLSLNVFFFWGGGEEINPRPHEIRHENDGSGPITPRNRRFNMIFYLHIGPLSFYVLKKHAKVANGE